MTRAEAFDKAWRIGAKEKDFSFVDEIYHAEYSSSDVFTDVKVNLDEDKSVYMALAESLIVTPPKTVLESGDHYNYSISTNTETLIFSIQLSHYSITKKEKSLVKVLLWKN